MDKIKIDVVSDVACPWCYVGKKNLEAAIPNKEMVEIEWHPFQLDPSIPKEGINKETYFTNKFGSMERFELMSEHLIKAGQKAGINFDFTKMKKAVNTLALHQLLEIAGREGFKDSLKAKFLQANFELGLDLSETEVLFKICKEFGWTKEKIEQICNDDLLATLVKNEIKQFQNLGVSGVPFFIFNNKYAVSGAQPIEVFKDLIDKIKQETKPSNLNGEMCNINYDNC